MKELNRIFIEGTPKVPQIDFDHRSGELILSGRSIPENAAKVYEPVLEWIKLYTASPSPTTNFRLNLEYFNTASTIWIAKIIRTLSTIRQADHVLFVHLYVDLEDSETLDQEEVRDLIGSITDNIVDPGISIGVKIHAVDETGKVVKESLVFI
jgi:hypothetical protein